MACPLHHGQGEKHESKVKRAFIEPDPIVLTAPAVCKPESGFTCPGPDVNLAVEPCRNRIASQREYGVFPEGVFAEGIQRLLCVAVADVPLRDTKNEDDERGDED